MFLLRIKKFQIIFFLNILQEIKIYSIVFAGVMLNSLLMVLTLNFYLTCCINKSKNKQIRRRNFLIFYFFFFLFSKGNEQNKKFNWNCSFVSQGVWAKYIQNFVVVSFLKKQQAVFAWMLLFFFYFFSQHLFN